jgi:hypothetical protein
MRVRIACVCLLLALASNSGAQQNNDSKVDFIGNYLEVIGIGYPPQGRGGLPGYGLAKRAAELVAYQHIAEATKDFVLKSTTQVDSQTITIDRISNSITATMKTCTIADRDDALQSDYLVKGFVTLHCRIPLAGTGTDNGPSVMAAISNAAVPEVKRQIQEQVQKGELKPTPPPLPPNVNVPDYDGLIVKVPARFKPSLFPKILTDKGELVYSVNDVPDRILRSNGMAQYTNDPGKAAALLRDGGAQNPLTIDGFLSSDTEAGVKADDAAKITAANKKTSFLSSARVVFVVAKS